MVLVALCPKTSCTDAKEKRRRIKKRLEKKSHVCFFFKEENNLIFIPRLLYLLKERHIPRFVRILLWLPKMSQQAFHHPRYPGFLEGCPVPVTVHEYHPLQG